MRVAGEVFQCFVGARLDEGEGLVAESRHLANLREEGVVGRRGEAQNRFYSLKDFVVCTIFHAFCEICEQRSLGERLIAMTAFGAFTDHPEWRVWGGKRSYASAQRMTCFGPGTDRPVSVTDFGIAAKPVACCLWQLPLTLPTFAVIFERQDS